MNEKIVVSGGHDNTIKIWDLKKGKCIKTIDTKTVIYDVKCSPDGKYIVSCGGDDKIKFYSSDNWKLVKVF